MNDEEFLVWCRRYCAIFMQDLGRISETLKEWRLVFTKGRFTANELNAALSAMASNPPDDRWQHLRCLLESVREIRSEAVEAAATVKMLADRREWEAENERRKKEPWIPLSVRFRELEQSNGEGNS
jgi:hypothetical protein